MAKVGGGDPLSVSLSINIGSALVDVSPLSTLGALCVATVTDHAESRVLFRQLMLWGLSMAVVGALLFKKSKKVRMGAAHDWRTAAGFVATAPTGAQIAGLGRLLGDGRYGSL